ncbi:MAG TPA: hypothetical protein VHC69_09330 [Polyangiaceae bacterium]|nr:hypothetical protein [Polyangiaceae bacterium]
MYVFHELVWDGYLSGSAAVYSKMGLEELLGRADKLSVSGYAAGMLGTTPTLTVQVEQSFDQARWMPRNAQAEINALALSTTTDTNFAGQDGDPTARPGAPYARLRISLAGANAAGQLRIWVTGTDPDFE